MGVGNLAKWWILPYEECVSYSLKFKVKEETEKKSGTFDLMSACVSSFAKFSSGETVH